MLYNLDFLQRGQTFPPISEVERLKEYEDSRELFKGNTETVLADYQKRINDIVSRLELSTVYKMDINYHRLLTVKTADLVCGEMPSISVDEAGKKDDLRELLSRTKFKQKLYEAVIDVSRLGDSLARIYYDADQKKYDFVIIPPDMWFPVVDKEIIKKVKQHVLCWISESPNSTPNNPKYLLNAQIHEKGRYINRVFEIKKSIQNQPIQIASRISQDLQHARTFNITTYEIGAELTDNPQWVSTGLDNFAIVPLQNLTLPESIYGCNDYEPITPLIAELETRCMLESIVLDKHTAPTMYGGASSFRIDPITGGVNFATGKGIMVQEGEIPPGYVTWDASLQANHECIQSLKDLLYSISEMGAVINDASFAASQGYEALMTRLTSARMKARRVSDNLTDSVKKIISLVSKNDIKETELTVVWNDGIPDTELQNINVANQKLNLFSLKDILMEHFSVSEQEADEIIARKTEEDAVKLASGFSLGMGGENG